MSTTEDQYNKLRDPKFDEQQIVRQMPLPKSATRIVPAKNLREGDEIFLWSQWRRVAADAAPWVPPVDEQFHDSLHYVTVGVKRGDDAMIQDAAQELISLSKRRQLDSGEALVEVKMYGVRHLRVPIDMPVAVGESSATKHFRKIQEDYALLAPAGRDKSKDVTEAEAEQLRRWSQRGDLLLRLAESARSLGDHKLDAWLQDYRHTPQGGLRW